VAALEAYPWPGNVRELKNVVQRAVDRADAALVDATVFDPFESPYRRAAPQEPTGQAPQEEAAPQALPPVGTAGLQPFDEAVKDFEVKLLREALERARFNQRKAADLLGLT